MSDVLARICADKRRHIEAAKAARGTEALLRAAKAAPPVRGFRRALVAARAGGTALIAEIKKASPSKGVIRPDFDPSALARGYAAGGATCLSVLTDSPYFQGADGDLSAARAAAPALPVLRKDFFLDPYQAIEARAIGADCILLILAAVEDAAAAEIEAAAHDLGMDVLVEVHDAAELERASRLKCRLIGINNRDLATLEVDLATTERLAPRAPADALVVSESGLTGPADLDRMRRAGVGCFLIGETLLRERDVAAAVRALLGTAGAAVPATAGA